MQFTLTLDMDRAGIRDAADVALELRKLAELLIDTHNANNSELPLQWDAYDRSGPILADGMRVGQWEFRSGKGGQNVRRRSCAHRPDDWRGCF